MFQKLHVTAKRGGLCDTVKDFAVPIKTGKIHAWAKRNRHHERRKATTTTQISIHKI